MLDGWKHSRDLKLRDAYAKMKEKNWGAGEIIGNKGEKALDNMRVEKEGTEGPRSHLMEGTGAPDSISTLCFPSPRVFLNPRLSRMITVII